METLKLVQWGTEKCIVYKVNNKNGKVKFLMMSTDYFLMLDERGLIQ